MPIYIISEKAAHVILEDVEETNEVSILKRALHGET